MDKVLISFAFLAGLQAFFAPCSIALLPAYVGYYIKQENEKPSKIQQLLFGLKAGSVASLGLISVYVVFAVITAIFGRLIVPIFPWIEFITGTILIFLGSASLLGYQFAVRLPILFKTTSSGIKNFYLFGVALASGASSCTLPIFMLVVFQSLAQQNILGGVINFVVYALTMSGLMIIFSLISSLSKNAMHKFLHQYMAIFQKSAGILILFAGIYLIYLALQIISL